MIAAARNAAAERSARPRRGRELLSARELPIEFLESLALLSRMRGARQWRKIGSKQLHCRPITCSRCQYRHRNPDPFGGNVEHAGEKTNHGPDHRDRVDAVSIPIGAIGLKQGDQIDAHVLDEEIIGN